MLKLIGAVLVISGCIGLGYAICNDFKRKRTELYHLQEILEMIKSEVGYSKSTLPEACRMVAERISDPYQGTLKNISDRMRANTGLSFRSIWQQEMDMCLKKRKIPEKERKIILGFADTGGFADNGMQIKMIEKSAALIKESADKAGNDIENKEKAVMSLSLTAGIILTLVLL